MQNLQEIRVKEQRPGCNLFSSFFKVRKSSDGIIPQNQEVVKPVFIDLRKSISSTHQKSSQGEIIDQQQVSGIAHNDFQDLNNLSPKHTKNLSLSQITNKIYKVSNTKSTHPSIPPLPHQYSKNTSNRQNSILTTRISLNQSEFNQPEAFQIDSARDQRQSLDYSQKEENSLQNNSVMKSYQSISNNFIKDAFQQNSQNAINMIVNTRLQIDESNKFQFKDERQRSKSKSAQIPPKYSVPFVIFKSEKPLTTFKQFQLSTNQRSVSRGRNRINSCQTYRNAPGQANKSTLMCSNESMISSRLTPFNESRNSQDLQIPNKQNSQLNSQANQSQRESNTTPLMDYFKKFSGQQMMPNATNLR